MSAPPPVASAKDANDRFASNLKVLFDVIAAAATDLIRAGYKGVANPTLIKFAKFGVFELAELNGTDILLTFLKSSYSKWDRIVAEDIQFVEKHIFDYVLPEEHADDEKAKQIAEQCKEIASSILGCKTASGNYAVEEKYISKIGTILKTFIGLSVKYAFFLMKPIGCIQRDDGSFKYTFEKTLPELEKINFDINWAIKEYNVTNLPTY